MAVFTLLLNRGYVFANFMFIKFGQTKVKGLIAAVNEELERVSFEIVSPQLMRLFRFGAIKYPWSTEGK